MSDTKKIVVIGEPVGKRTEISGKLSRFFDIPMFTAKDLIKCQKNICHDHSNEVRYKLALMGDSNRGFVLNGLPLDEQDCKCLGNVDLAIFFNVNSENIVQYNKDRRWCPTCFKSYHLASKPPLKEGTCDRCGHAIESTPNDDPTTIRKRVSNWYQRNEGVLGFYSKKKILLEVMNDKDIENIAKVSLNIIEGNMKPGDDFERLANFSI